MSTEAEARAAIEVSFLDCHQYQTIREDLEELFEDVNKIPCELNDDDLQIWFFNNYIYIVEDSMWRHRLDVLQ